MAAAAQAAAREQGRAGGRGDAQPGLLPAGGRARSTLLKQPPSATTSEGSNSLVFPTHGPGVCGLAWDNLGTGGVSGRVLQRERRASAFRDQRVFASFPFCEPVRDAALCARAWRGRPASAFLGDLGRQWG